MRNRADNVYSSAEETLGHFNKHPEICLFTCLAHMPLIPPGRGASWWFFQKVTIPTLSLPLPGRAPVWNKSLPASLVGRIFGKMCFRCNSREPMGISTLLVALGIPLWRWYFCSVYKMLELAVLSAWVGETVFKWEVNYCFLLVTHSCCFFLLHLPILQWRYEDPAASSPLQSHHQCLNIAPKT